MRIWCIDQDFDLGGVVTTKRFASRYWLTPADDGERPGVQYEGRIATWPKLDMSLVEGQKLRGSSSVDRGSVELVDIANALSGLGDPRGLPTVIYAGDADDGFEGLDEVFRGVCESWRETADGRRRVLTYVGEDDVLDVPLQRRRLKGYGYAVNFPTSGVISFPHDASQTPATELWVRARVRLNAGTLSTGTIVAKGTGISTSLSYGLFVEASGNLLARVTAGGVVQNARVLSAFAADGVTWHLVELHWLKTSSTTATLTVYHDGVQGETKAISSGSILSTANQIRIGRDSTGSLPLLGTVDDVQIFVDTDRSGSIGQDGPLPADDRSGLVLYAPMDEGIGSSTYDVVAGIAGTITSGTWVDTLTGQREQAGTTMPVALGDVPIARGVRLNARTHLWADEPIEAITHLEIGGQRLAPKFGAFVINDLTFEAARRIIKTAGFMDPRALAIGQLIKVDGTPGGTNDGIYTVAAMPANIGNLGVPGGPPTQYAICVEETLTDQSSVSGNITSVAPTEISETNIWFTAPSTIGSTPPPAFPFVSLVPGQVFTIVDAAGGGVNDGTYTVASATGTVITTVETSITTQAAGPTIELTALVGTWEYEVDLVAATTRTYAPVDGAVTAGVRESTAEIDDLLTELVEERAAGTVDAADLSALAALRGGEHFYFAPGGEEETVRLAVDRVVQGAGAVWRWVDGAFTAWILGDPDVAQDGDVDITLDESTMLSIERVETIDAIPGVLVNFARNYGILREGDMRTSVAEDDSLAGEDLRARITTEWLTSTAGETGVVDVDTINAYTTSRLLSQTIASEMLSRDGTDRAYYAVMLRRRDLPALRGIRAFIIASDLEELVAGRWTRPITCDLEDENRVRVVFWG